MTASELWNYFWNKRIAQAHPFDRDFIWVEKKDFESMKKYFVPEFNIFHLDGGSMRSRGYWKHIQAVTQENCVFIHQDTGNVALFFPLAIVHFFADVLPYLVFISIKGVSLKTLTERPLK